MEHSCGIHMNFLEKELSEAYNSNIKVTHFQVLILKNPNQFRELTICKT